jgi:hypothetical protein
MRCRFFKHFASVAVFIPVLAGGCVQATRHSNTLLFGTNTSFGIKVGTDPTQVPSVVVGYDRQEAVIVPLVANVAETEGSNGTGARLNRLTPCDLTKPVTATGAPFAVHPCSLVAVNGKALDSYSVLASFGAEFDASGGTSNSAKGGLAQYFATGIAAQLLATTGGASVVAVGNAATASAIKAPDAEKTIEQLYGTDAAFTTGRGIAVGPFDKFVTRFEALVEATDEKVLQTKVQTFETAASVSNPIGSLCTDRKSCKERARNAYAIDYLNNQAGMEAAISAWTIP